MEEAASRGRLRTMWVLVRLAFREWWEDNTFRLAASLAFYTIFSLAPILLIAVEIASVVFNREQAQQQIVKQIEALVGVEGGRAIQEVLRGAGRISGNLTAVVLGLVAILIGSTAVFAELQSALNQMWDVRADPQRNAIKELVWARLRSFALVLAVGFLLLVSLVLSALLAAVQDYLADQTPDLSWVWHVGNFLVSFAVVSGLFAMIYKYLPDVQTTWRDVAIGAVVTAVLFSLGKWLIGLYLGRTAFASTYGAAGSFVVLLIWVYYSALVSFLGAEFTQVYARRFGSRIRPEPHAVRVGKKSERLSC
jgi:membrane protein